LFSSFCTKKSLFSFSFELDFRFFRRPKMASNADAFKGLAQIQTLKTRVFLSFLTARREYSKNAVFSKFWKKRILL